MSQPYKLYGASELKSLEKTITDKVQRWLGEWSSNVSSLNDIEISVENKPALIDAELYSSNYSCGDSILAVSIDRTLYESFPSILLPVNSASKIAHSALVKDILNKAFFDLIKAFLANCPDIKLECRDLQKDVTGELSVNNASGDLFVKLEFSNGCFYLKLPYQVVNEINEFDTGKKPQSGGLRNRRDCVINGELKLNVNVGGADIDFGSVVAMQAGDVIRLDSKITDMMTVTTEEGDFVCNASLGKQGQQKAIRVKI